MAYVIYTRDRPETAAIRAEYRLAHLDYLAEWETRLIASGGQQTESGQVVGGVIILDVATIEEAEDFVKNDPFNGKGLLEEVVIRKFFQTYLHGRADREPFVALPRKAAVE